MEFIKYRFLEMHLNINQFSNVRKIDNSDLYEAIKVHSQLLHSMASRTRPDALIIHFKHKRKEIFFSGILRINEQ